MKRFVKVTDNLFRCGSPTFQDLSLLKDQYSINKVISLDETIGNHISRFVKLLNINHIIIPIERNKIEPLIELLNYDLTDLLKGKTLVHCKEGKDRTGMLIAMFRCQQGWPYQKALDEALSLGFGVGMDPKITETYKKVIKLFDQDNNSADIVNNAREDRPESHPVMPSFSPYMDMQYKDHSWFEDNKIPSNLDAIENGHGFIIL